MKDAKNLFVYNLKRLLNARGETQADLARGLGKTESTVSDWAKGKTMPRAGSLQDIAEYFNVNISELTAQPYSNEEDYDKRRLNDIYDELNTDNRTDVINYAQSKLDEQQSTKEVPFVGYAAAGTSAEPYHADAGDETMNTDTEADAYVVLTGDSMEPRFQKGQAVFYRLQPDIENGELAIVDVDGEGAIFKQVKFDYKNRKIILHSLNPKYSDIVLDPSRVRILGKVLL